MKKNRQKLNSSRRDFMRKSAIAGAGVVAVSAAGGEAMASVPENTEKTPQKKGYRLTAHILEYYKSAAS